VGDKLSNKERERHFVEVLKSLLKDFPDGEIVADENQERPDVIVKNSRKKIGIEVTCIHTQELKREESEIEAVISEARCIYEKLNLPKLLQVSVIVGNGKVFNRKNRSVLASAIAKLVSDNVPSQDGPVELENDWNNQEVFPFEINAIHIYRLSKATQSLWTAPSVGFFREDFVDELQQIISGKEELLPGYDPDCTEHWLLVVGENGSASTFFDPSEFTLNHHYESSFKRAFFMDSFSRKLFELKLR
jgi:hypothetical protein